MLELKQINQSMLEWVHSSNHRLLPADAAANSKANMMK